MSSSFDGGQSYINGPSASLDQQDTRGRGTGMGWAKNDLQSRLKNLEGIDPRIAEWIRSLMGYTSPSKYEM